MPIIKSISSWSFSSLKQFEKCPYSQFLKRIKREPTPEQPEDSPLLRGNRIHEEAEHFVDGRLPEMPKSLNKFKLQFDELKEAYNEGSVTLEGEWGFDHVWEPCAYNDWDRIWLRVKGDAVTQHDKETFTIVDYKTGKSWGNEVSHVQQGQLYAIALMVMYPEAQSINVEFWYLDEAKTKRRTYTRSQLIKVMASFDRRGQAMTSATEFPAKANAMNCKYCDYGVFKGNSKCQYAVSPVL